MPAGKKKKAAINPARGFATKSVVSKAKATEDVLPKAEETKGEADTSLHSAGTITRDQSFEAEQSEKDLNLNDLTSEEYAKHLEDAHLQQLLEKHVERSIRDVKRHAGRLKTEQRLWKSSAENLHLAQWLPQELLLLINDRLDNPPPAESKHATSLQSEVYNEDGLLITVWTLYRTLLALGISIEHTCAALRYVLEILPTESLASCESNASEHVWGLDESFEWLARHASPNELSYAGDASTAGKSHGTNLSEGSQSKDILAPCLQMPEHEDWSNAPGRSRESSPKAVNQSKASLSNCPSSEVSTKDSPRLLLQSTPPDSTSESDDDPEALAKKYSNLLLRLYEVNASLANVKYGNLTQKRSKRLQNIEEPSPQVSRVLKKMATIEADVLFDRYEAAERWVELRNSQAKVIADRKTFRLATNGVTHSTGAESDVTKTSLVTPDGGAGQGVDVLDTLGDFLSQLPGDDDKVIGQTQTHEQGVSDIAISVKNFGKSSGIRPRRVLEETCKARSVDDDRLLTDSYLLLHPIAI